MDAQPQFEVQHAGAELEQQRFVAGATRPHVLVFENDGALDGVFRAGASPVRDARPGDGRVPFLPQPMCFRLGDGA